MHSVEFQNMRLDHIITHPNADIIVAFGSRSCVILNSALEVRQRYLDASKTECFQCAVLVDLPRTKNSSVKHSDLVEASRKAPSPLILLVLGGDDGVIKAINIADGLLYGILKGHTGPICSLAYAKNLLVSGSADSSIRLWSLLSMECHGILGGMFGHRDYILSLDIHSESAMLVSAGADATIRQWDLSKILSSDGLADGKSYIFPPRPFSIFKKIHNTAITSVMYYGDFIVSLSNNHISVLYNNCLLEDINREEMAIDNSTPIFIGAIDTYETCKYFRISKHILVSVGASGDIYLFDLRDIGVEKTPFIVKSKFDGVIDFAMLGDYIYVTTGRFIHKHRMNISQFDNYMENSEEIL